MGELPHADDHRTVPTPGVCSEESILGVASKRIDEIAEVPQSITSPFSSDHNSDLGTRASGSKV